MHKPYILRAQLLRVLLLRALRLKESSCHYNTKLTTTLMALLLCGMACFSHAESPVIKSYKGSDLLVTNKPRLDDYAADFILKSHHKDNIRLNELRGNIVLIEFWASWSGPSIHNVKQFEQLYQDHKDKDFKVLSITIDPEKSQRISEKLNPEHSILFDFNRSVSRLYRVDTIPSFYLLDKSGKIALILEGIDQRYYDIIEHKLKRMLDEEND